MPQGAWLYFKNLPASTTDESLSAYFRERGLDIGPECIGLRLFAENTYTPTAHAMVSVPHDVVLVMLQWVLNSDPIEGMVPYPELARCSKRNS